MFDAQCELAALVYEPHQDPDAVLRGFAADRNAHGLRVVGMVQAGQCADSSLSAILLHSGEKMLLAQDFDPCASGCRLDLARLQNAGERIAEAMGHGADLVIINRFGKRERDGKGLGYGPNARSSSAACSIRPPVSTVTCRASPVAQCRRSRALMC